MNAFKPMLAIDSISIVQRLIPTLRRAGANPVLIATGNQAEKPERHVSRTGVVCLRNKPYADTRMFDSAKTSFSCLPKQCDRILFTPCGCPVACRGNGTAAEPEESGSGDKR